jgi:hypothetical protein
VTADLSRPGWLSDLVDGALRAHDPAAARLRLPGEGAGPDLESRAGHVVAGSIRRAPAPGGGDGAFLALVEGHVELLLDLALMLEVPFDVGRRRAELAAILAAGTGELAAALKAAPGGGRAPPEAAVQRALARAGAALLRLHHPPGDPAGGLPLFAGTVAAERRLLSRLGLARFQDGALDPDRALEELERSRDELALLVEALAGLAAAEGPLSHAARHLAQRQVERLGLERERARLVRARVAGPRTPAEICGDAPPRLRELLVEQLLLATLGAPPSPAAREHVERFAEAAGVAPDRLAELRAEAAGFHADHAAWFHPLEPAHRPEGADLAQDWSDLGERLVERAAAAVSQNVEAIVTELRETGEMGALIARAASGQTLDADERRRVKEQLLDLAKAVPALAIFAAPGGLVLLPLLAKVLPFDLLPSAFHHPRRGAAERPGTAPPGTPGPGPAAAPPEGAETGAGRPSTAGDAAPGRADAPPGGSPPAGGEPPARPERA